MSKYVTAAALLGALALTGSGLSVAQAEQPPRQCFSSPDWSSWKAADEHTMYLRVSGRRVYRLDFASGCSAMTMTGVHLVTVMRGSSQICSPLDIDLKVSDGHGFSEPCIVSKMSQLSDAEIAALPKQVRP